MIQHELKLEIGRSNVSLIDEFVQRLSKTQNIQEVVSIIEQIVEEPWIHVYAQFLDLKQVQALLNTEYEKHYNLLKLFAYGKYQNYKNQQEFLPQLSAKMIEHLRQLTIVSLGEKNQIISYETLKNETDLESIRELEALIIETISLNLIKGIINQENCCLKIHETVARDVRREDFSVYIGTLRDWFKKCDHILATIENEICRATGSYAVDIVT